MKLLASLSLLGLLAGCATASVDPKPAASPAVSATAEAAARAADADPGRAWSDAQQMVLVITPGPDATTGRMRAFDRVDGGWKPAGEAFDVTVGRSGIAWGIGLHPPQPGLSKREGDGRAPEGVFRIGTAFGYADTARTGLEYAPMSATHWCVDVDGAPLYNRIVDSRDVGEAAVAGSTEPMRRDIHAQGDQRYRLGFVIEHNADGRAGGGSCIFAHLWKAPGEPTAGCTAMDAAAMDRLLAWLREDRHPVFVQLTEADAARLAADWRLPSLAD
jgi:L,D-peptidoglycan transpeptidase YkuD (ErfK/YbiS/YcfS/YnhG family)